MSTGNLSGYDGGTTTGLGRRLRQAREAAGLSQRGAAKLLGNITHGAISQWESTGQVSTDNLLRAVEAYRADATWVLTGKAREQAGRDLVDRAVMTDAITAVLTVLQDMGRQPPPAVTARIINLIHNRHVESGDAAPLDAGRVKDIVGGVIEYLNDRPK